MKTNKFFFPFGFIVAAILFAGISAHADEADQLTKITFNQSTEIPGQVLPAGTYLFKVLDINNFNVVEIFNADGTGLCATVRTVPTERPQPASETTITLAEPGAGRPDALVRWFYPGETIGHQFVYSRQEQELLAKNLRQIVVNDTNEAGD